MRDDRSSEHSRSVLTYPTTLVFLVFAVIALAFLWQEHQGHILPYLLLLLCPLMHVFMHGRHHHGHRPQTSGRPVVQEHRGEQS